MTHHDTKDKKSAMTTKGSQAFIEADLCSNFDLEDIIFSAKANRERRIFYNSFNKQKNICYHKNWIWKNENKNTNTDFFLILMKQRIKEGFYYINRGCDNHKYLFVKLLPALK